ncbi:MAG: DegT/DnrJ/EryC1/StrS family aminotransferase [candidate division Zixibacteria bacterium]|nr:DegT/DnrJ/EryC1/StrS family aminotransferase [candidate division Zixibacteria bacterium]
MEKSTVIKLIRPRLSQSEIQAVNQVLETGMLVSGPVVQRFENSLAEYLGVKHVICVSSGTAALHLSLLAAGIKPQDEVIVPAFTFPATANVVENVGAVPIFVDCGLDGLNLDVNDIERHIGPQTRAIMPVHGLGFPADMDIINDIAAKYNLTVIEDAACALGSRYKNRLCGTIGDIGAFSFHPRKLLTTGEGGAIVVKDEITASLVKSLRNHGYDDGDYRYAGYNYRMTDFQAAMGLSQLDSYAEYLEERKKLAHELALLLGRFHWLEVIKPEIGTEPNCQTFVVRLAEDIDRKSLLNFLASRNIEATIGTYCVPMTHYYRVRYGYRAEEFPKSYDSYNRLVSLPLYHGMKPIEMVIIFEALKDFTIEMVKELV